MITIISIIQLISRFITEIQGLQFKGTYPVHKRQQAWTAAKANQKGN